MISSQATADHDVIIIGLGPTGATLANLLGICGLSVLIVEKEAQIYALPRAVHFDDEIMRVFQTIGIAPELADKVFINRGMRFVDRDHNLLLDWPRPQDLTDNGWNASYRFHQPDLEDVLRQALTRFDNIDIRLSHVAENLTEDGDLVTVHFRNTGTDEIHQATARYVVGCDGARSIVRGVIKTDMWQLGFEQRWLVTDVLLKRDMPELGDHTIQFCDPVRPVTYCRNPGNRRRWEFALLAEEDSTEMAQEESVWRLLDSWISRTDADIERSAVYTFKSEVAQDWKRGRLLLAGDAAHLTPPFMGQGMCAGIRDAANLAWKLALCCKGRAAATLLDSYQSERKPNVTEYIETAARLGALINRIGTGKATEPGTGLKDGSINMKTIQSRLGPGLGTSGNPRRGELFPQPRLNNGRALDDVIGYQPLLVVGNQSPGCNLPDGLQIIRSADEPEIASVLNGMGSKAVLIRPDRYVLDSSQGGDDIHHLIENALPSPLG